jgi:hypothetical protein
MRLSGNRLPSHLPQMTHSRNILLVANTGTGTGTFAVGTILTPCFDSQGQWHSLSNVPILEPSDDRRLSETNGPRDRPQTPSAAGGQLKATAAPIGQWPPSTAFSLPERVGLSRPSPSTPPKTQPPSQTKGFAIPPNQAPPHPQSPINRCLTRNKHAQRSETLGQPSD